MKQITVLVDKSGSMNVLGKNSICEDLLKFLHLYPQINSCENDLSFAIQDWDGSNEELKNISDKVDYLLILTDGYTCNDNCESTLQSLSSDQSKQVVIVLIGADAYFRQVSTESKIPVYKASNIDVVALNFARDKKIE